MLRRFARTLFPPPPAVSDPLTQVTQVTRLFAERLQAWKHACGYFEDYIKATEKMEHGLSKDYEKVLKTVEKPLKEGHHFEQNVGGVAGLLDNVRSNTQASFIYIMC